MEISDIYSGTLYKLYVKSVIKNYPNVSHCSEVKGTNGLPKYLRVIQDGEEHKFYYDDIKPYMSIDDLKKLEDRMFSVLR